MPAEQQLLLPFASLDFPGRDTVKVWEIAAKLGCSDQHILEHIDAGKLVAINSALVPSRRNLRVPVDEYRRWCLGLLTGPARRTFLAELPSALRHEIIREGIAHATVEQLRDLAGLAPLRREIARELSATLRT